MELQAMAAITSVRKYETRMAVLCGVMPRGQGLRVQQQPVGGLGSEWVGGSVS
jgi:hypothetical protein